MKLRQYGLILFSIRREDGSRHIRYATTVTIRHRGSRYVIAQVAHGPVTTHAPDIWHCRLERYPPRQTISNKINVNLSRSFSTDSDCPVFCLRLVFTTIKILYLYIYSYNIVPIYSSDHSLYVTNNKLLKCSVFGTFSDITVWDIKILFTEIVFSNYFGRFV